MVRAWNVVALLLVVCVPASAGAQTTCDRNLIAHGSPYAYRERGDRCEGIYVQELSSTTLQVASFVESFEDFSLTTGGDLAVRWTAADSDRVTLQARGLRPNLFYRMDTAVPAGNPSYSWPIGILASLSIRQRDLGVLGWTQRPIGATLRRVYLPLRIGQQREARRSSSYQLTLWPGRQLSEVYVRLAAVRADGRPGSVIRNGEPLKYGHYPADRALIIPISPPSPGLYHLEIGADLAGGGATTTQLYFLHAAR